MEIIRENTPERVYNFIVDYTIKHLYPPSIIEIQENTGIKSSSAVTYNLQKLANMGYIELGSKQARTIKLVGYELVKKL